MQVPIESPKYDVAISFLSRDEAVASAIDQKLAGGLEVFFFPRKQEELAGTDGLESMRTPFFDDSRLMVVLYREPWGKTPWTRVEETAIKEACLVHGWQRLFFIVLDSQNTLPVWLPTNYVRFNYADFGLEQAVGAIKARVQENGGHVSPLTAMKRAQLLEAEQAFLRDKARMNSDFGLDKIQDSVLELFEEIKKQCDAIGERGSIQIRCAFSFAKGNALQSCAITNGHVGLTVAWSQRYSNTLDGSGLVVREFNGGLILPNQTGVMYSIQPETLDERKYSPDLSLSREYGWREDGGTNFISSRSLAGDSVTQFLDLVSRSLRGELPKRSFF